MDDRGEEDAAAGDEDETAEEGVEGGENFRDRAGQVGAVNGAFAAHEHGGFEEGIEPGESAEVAVAEDPEEEGEGDQHGGEEEVIGHPPEEDGMRGDGLAVMLKGHSLLVDRPGRETKRQERARSKISEKVGRARSAEDGRSEMGYGGIGPHRLSPAHPSFSLRDGITFR